MAAHSFHIEPLRLLGGLDKHSALALLAVLFLGACSAAEPQTMKHTSRTVEDARVIAPDLEEDGPDEAETEDLNRPDSGGTSGEDEEEQIPEQDATLPMDFTNFKDRLLGLDNDDLSDLMGSPSLEREEPPATIWQYRNIYCVVDIFLYPNGGENRVDHVEVRGRQSDEIDKPACFAAIIKGKDKPKAPAEEDPSRKTAVKTPAAGPPDSAPPEADQLPPATSPLPQKLNAIH